MDRSHKYTAANTIVHIRVCLGGGGGERDSIHIKESGVSELVQE